MTKRRMNWAVLTLMAMFTALSTGCMQTPGDQEHIGNYQAPVHFSGVTGYDAEPIDIEAWNFKSASWMKIGDTMSDLLPLPDTDGEVFPWDISYVVPSSCWYFQGLANPLGQFRAHVRAVVTATGEVLEADGSTSYATIYGDFIP